MATRKQRSDDDPIRQTELILKLYELRRETVMREARSYVGGKWSCFRVCVALSEGGFSNVGYLDPPIVSERLKLGDRRSDLFEWRVVPYISEESTLSVTPMATLELPGRQPCCAYKGRPTRRVRSA